MSQQPPDPYGSNPPLPEGVDSSGSTPSGGPAAGASPLGPWSQYDQQPGSYGYTPPEQAGYGGQGYGGPEQPGGPAGSRYPPQGSYPPPQGYPPQPTSWSPPGRPPAGPPVSESDERLWATLSHASIPFLGFLGPLVVYLVFKDRSPWLRANAAEALNFSIFYTLAQFVCSLLTIVVIGLVLLPLVFIGGLVLCVLGAVAAYRHELYRYPVNWRLVS